MFILAVTVAKGAKLTGLLAHARSLPKNNVLVD